MISLTPLRSGSALALLCVIGLHLSCRSTPKPAAPLQPRAQSQPPSSPKSSTTIAKAPPEPSKPQEEISLRLSTLPKDAMAVAQVRAGFNALQAKLTEGLDTPPQSLLRSLPLSVILSLRQLSLLQPPQAPFDQRPLAIVWDPKQRAFWMWNQSDTSLAARHALERSLQATTHFSPPYWIFESPDPALEYFVHSKAGWLIASPKAWAPAIREWLTDVSKRDIGTLPWAPDPSLSAALTLRWRAPQLLESAPQAPLPVIGTLDLDQTLGLRVNGGARSQP